VPLDGYDLLVRAQGWVVGDMPAAGWAVRGDEQTLVLTLAQDGATVATFPLAPLIDTLRTSGAATRGLDPERLTVESAGPRGGRLYLRYVAGRTEDGRIVITDVAGDVVLATAPAER